MRALAIQRGAAPGDLAGRILCQDIRGPKNEILLRKGHALRADDLPILFAGERDEVHLLELEPGDIGQREAGQRLAEAIRSPGLRPMPSGHRHVLRATQDGLLKIDATALQRLNTMPGIAVFTLMSDQVVVADQVVAEAQITPLAIRRRAIEAAELIARERPIIRFLPLVPREVILWKREERIVNPLTEKLRRFGCSLRETLDLPRDFESIRTSIEARRDSGATLFLISGSNALDPLDPVFVALEQIGAHMQRIGIPVHPGTLLWIAVLDEITIIGLPSCGLGQITAFDLLLPKLLAEGRIREQEITALGHGGILRPAPVILSREDGEGPPAEEDVAPDQEVLRRLRGSE